MNKPITVALAAMAVLFGSVAVGGANHYASAQYGLQYAGNVSPEQLKECEDIGISRETCTEQDILAKRRLLAAQANPSTGSGTPMLSTDTGQMAIFIGVLGAIFGGVAAAFFLKGRGAKPIST